MESQQWWQNHYADGTPIPGSTATNFGHVHSGACFPNFQTVSGVLHFNVRTLMHDNPTGVFVKLKPQTVQNGSTEKEWPAVQVNQTCGTSDCEFWTPYDMDLSTLPYSGWTIIRLRSYVLEEDGDTALATDSWLVYVSNGKTRKDQTLRCLTCSEARGWYGTVLRGANDRGYENAELRTLVPATVSGVWTPTVKTSFTGGTVVGGATDHTIVTVDPGFHAIPPNMGIVLRDATGAYNGTVSIDTTTLANGTHKLVIISQTDWNDSLAPGIQASGVEVIPFVVAN